MIISLKKKYTLKVDEFQFRCSIGKNGIKKNKKEGDKCTPKGIFKLNKIFFRHDRVNFFKTKLKKVKIMKYIGWCNDSKNQNYNKLIKMNKKIKHEKLYRKDYKYDYLIELSYNTEKVIPYKGSAIFLHLTKDYKPTLGCVAINKNDMQILLRIIQKNTFIKIY